MQFNCVKWTSSLWCWSLLWCQPVFCILLIRCTCRMCLYHLCSRASISFFSGYEKTLRSYTCVAKGTVQVLKLLNSSRLLVLCKNVYFTQEWSPQIARTVKHPQVRNGRAIITHPRKFFLVDSFSNFEIRSVTVFSNYSSPFPNRKWKLAWAHCTQVTTSFWSEKTRSQMHCPGIKRCCGHLTVESISEIISPRTHS